MLSFGGIGLQDVVTRSFRKTFYCCLAIGESNHYIAVIRRRLLPNENQISVFNLFPIHLRLIHRIAAHPEEKVFRSRAGDRLWHLDPTINVLLGQHQRTSWSLTNYGDGP